jgi:5'-3' exonuclease
MARLEVLDDAAVFAKDGVTPRQYADMATLRGDPSDGLPGVAGVGEKTAAQLLERYGDLTGILAAAGDPASPMAASLRVKLDAAADYLAVAPKVVEVVRDLRLPPFDAALRPLDDARAQELARLAAEHGLGTAVERAVKALDAAAQ